jgi:hypothetical protein
MAKRTAYVPPADRAAAGQLVTATALCESNRHHVCPGRIVSATAAHGAPCGCSCHDGDDLAVIAALEREHYGVASLWDV